LLSLLTGSKRLAANAAIEQRRLHAGGAPDYLAILSKKLIERWLTRVPSKIDLASADSVAVDPWHRDLTLLSFPSWRTSFSALMSTADSASNVLYQFLGSHNPYHVGHRVMIRSLIASGRAEDARMSVATMGSNGSKHLTPESYADRHIGVIAAIAREYGKTKAPVYGIDLPTGVGFSRDTTWHSYFMAALSGDHRIRIVMGSDKFAIDAHKLPDDAHLQRKYYDAKRSFFIVVRHEDEPDSIYQIVDSLPQTVRKRITVLNKVSYSPGPASSSLIRALRSSSHTADNELADLLTNGLLDRTGQVVRSCNSPTIMGADIGPTQSGSNNDSLTGRYEPEHGCIRFIVSRNNSRFQRNS
jgi:hypothetical protein